MQSNNLIVGSVLILTGTLLDAQERPRHGILDKTAPSWQVTQWTHLPAGHDTLDVKHFRNKVVYLFCFQSWCRGCHTHGFPALMETKKHYQDDPSVVFIAIQTAFEAEVMNAFSNGHATLRRLKLKIPLGQSGRPGEKSALMQSYRTGGTPWTIIIDRKGVVRFNDFFIKPKQAQELIDKLKQSNDTRGD